MAMWVAESLKIHSGFVVFFIQRKTKIVIIINKGICSEGESGRDEGKMKFGKQFKQQKWTGAYMDCNGLKKNPGRDLAVQAKQATLNTFEIHTAQINFAQTLQTSVD